MELVGSFKEPLIAQSSTRELPATDLLSNPNLHIEELIKDFTVYSLSYISTPFKGTCLQITKDRKSFVFGSREGRIAICDIETKQLMTDVDLKDGSIWSIAITQDDSEIFSGGQGGKIRRFKFSDLSELEALEGHNDEVNAVILSRDDQFLYSCSDDGKVKKWDLSGKPYETDLYKHEEKVYGLDISLQSETITSCAFDGSIFVFDLSSEQFIFSTTVPNTEQWCIKISPDEKFLISGGSDSLIQIWEFGTWEHLKVLKGHLSRVRCLNISHDGQFLISGGNDNLIKIWNLNSSKDELTIFGHQDWVKAILVSDDNQFIHTMSDDCTIMTSKITFSDIHINKSLLEPFLGFFFNPKDKHLYAVGQNSIYKNNQGEFDLFQTYTKPILSVHFVNEFTSVVVFFKQEKSTEIEVAHQTIGENALKSIKTLKTTSMVSSAAASEDGKFLFTGESFRVTIWNQVNGELIHVFKSHTGDVTALALNSIHLFAGDSKGVVKYYHLDEGFTEIAQFVTDSSATVQHLKISPNLRYLIYTTINNLFHVWSIRCKTLVREVTLSSPGSNLLVTSDSQNMFLSHADQLEIWNLDCFAKCAQLTAKENVVSLGFNSSEHYLLIGFQDHMQFLQNPLKTMQFSVFGHYDKHALFLDYVNRIIKGDVPKFDESMNSWVIEPYHMNILHVYAYFNLRGHLAKGLNTGAPFFQSRGGSTPLSIALDKRLQESSEIILEYFIKNAKSDPFILFYFSELLGMLNRSGYQKLSQVYEMLFRKCFSDNLPRFCERGVQIPLVRSSKYIMFTRNKFLSDEKYGKEEDSVEFIQSYVKVPSVCGSGCSLDFLSSLIECKNIEIFSSSLIKLILEEKWKTIKWIYIMETFLYLIYLTILCAYSKIKSIRSPYLLIAPMTISTILFLNEIIQIIYSGQKYFKSFWNYIDIFRFFLFTYYFSIIWGNYHSEETQTILLISSLTFSLLRGISYFRVHSSTRWVISLISEVFYQLWAMFSIALYIIVSLVIIYYSLSAENILKSFDFVEYEWSMLLAVMFINPLIILNLFISIVGDSFEKSQDEKVIKNGRDLAELVFEAELLLLCKRKDNQKKFVAVLREEHLEVRAQSTPGQRMKRIAEKIEELNGVAGGKAEEIEELKKWVEGRMMEIQERTQQVLERVMVSN